MYNWCVKVGFHSDGVTVANYVISDVYFRNIFQAVSTRYIGVYLLLCNLSFSLTCSV
jgi:hypothetical protein